MVLRFTSGSLDAFERVEKHLLGLDVHERNVVVSRNRVTTFCASPSRISP